ncbi:MAG: hypothetical protein QOH57_3830 [Mycobacterium sp.]|nr:hypothetical protein [Mycobacterium sp.]
MDLMASRLKLRPLRPNSRKPLRRLPILLVVAVALSSSPSASAAPQAASACPTHASPIKGKYTRTSNFGPRSDPAGFHPGWDMADPLGTEIDAAFDGKVRYAGAAQGYGNWIIIDSSGPDGGFATLYGHMYDDGLFVKPGALVKAGQKIAAVGTNGFSTGPHLHFGFYPGGDLKDSSAADPGPFLTGAPANPGLSGSTKLAASIANCPTLQTSGGIATGKPITPPDFVPWLVQAGKICQGIDAPLLAAQIESESGFNVSAKSPGNAYGPAQFIPSTWQTWGKEKDNIDPPEPGEINAIGDAVMAQGALMCQLYSEATSALAAGSVKGDPVQLALAGYNAGFGAVQQNGGIPPYPETMKYVQIIPQRRTKYLNDPQLVSGVGAAAPGAPAAPGDPAIAQVASEFVGRPWVWGGGDTNGPTNGGFDSPGFTRYVVFRATGGKLTLPRTVQQQWTVGTEIPLDQLQPGDLVFSAFSKSAPSHVAVAIDPKQVVGSYQGAGVANSGLAPDAKVRRVK